MYASKILSREVFISEATKRNWNKLQIDTSLKLISRANKKHSQKKIIPLEYFSNKENYAFIEELFYTIEEHDWKIIDILYTIATTLLKEKGLLEKPHVQSVLTSVDCAIIPELSEKSVPTDEKDLLGLVYQISLSEGQKNIAGSYYTHTHIASFITKNLDFSHNECFLDPCCGSGSFLLTLQNIHPNQIFGYDIDTVAVLIAKINLLLKFSDYEFKPQIFCANYLDSDSFFKKNPELKEKRFDYIMTNPPWGTNPSKGFESRHIVSNERFSQFFVTSFNQLKENGIIHFLLPESVLNVKTHKDIRLFMLNYTCLTKIIKYDDMFTGVTTKVVSIACRKSLPQQEVEEIYKGKSQKIPLAVFSKSENNVFLFLDNNDLEILDKVYSFKNYSLRNSTWALGLVTGNNKEQLKNQKEIGYEEIFTGKEITPFILKPAKNYIHYDRAQFQQVAKEEYYRAKEKLVYKFISNKLVFAYDNAQKLFLNSANILIPNIPHMSIKTVLAFLNSELYQFLYLKMFGQIKILKGNLEELPFPKISKEKNACIEILVDEILQGKIESASKLEDEVYAVFQLSEAQIEHVKGCF